MALAEACGFDTLDLKRRYMKGFSILAVGTCRSLCEAFVVSSLLDFFLTTMASFPKCMTSAERFGVYGSVENPDADKSFVCSPWRHRADGTDGLSVMQLLKALRLTPLTNTALGDCRWVCNSVCSSNLYIRVSATHGDKVNGLKM